MRAMAPSPPPRRVVFLDIDGVLNSHAYFITQQLGTLMDVLDPAAVLRLDALARRSGARVVISSSWRVKRPLDRLSAMLREHGFQGEVIGATPVLSLPRSLEIQAWLDAAPEPPDAFVILDDGEMDHLADRLVQTTFEEGLTDEHVEEALWRLGVGDDVG